MTMKPDKIRSSPIESESNGQDQPKELKTPKLLKGPSMQLDEVENQQSETHKDKEKNFHIDKKPA